MTYNGWTNWETWNLELWIDNSAWAYSAKVRLLETIDREVEESDVEEFVERHQPHSDLEPADLGQVNFEEIAESWESERQELLGEPYEETCVFCGGELDRHGPYDDACTDCEPDEPGNWENG